MLVPYELFARANKALIKFAVDIIRSLLPLLLHTNFICKGYNHINCLSFVCTASCFMILLL